MLKLHLLLSSSYFLAKMWSCLMSEYILVLSSVSSCLSVRNYIIYFQVETNRRITILL